MPDAFEKFDWRTPNYVPVFERRLESLDRIRRAETGNVELLLDYYRSQGGGGIADFIEDWGITFDPRNVERGIPSAVPFLLFPKQREYIRWVVDKWRNQQRGLVEKSRDGGISWLNVAIGCALCALYPGIVIGYGSRKTEYVDKADEPKSLFWKARYFMRHLPVEFRAGWREAVDAPYMRLKFPATNSFMNGEGGDDIGRGDRAAIYFVDEAAHLARPIKVEASLSQTTNCRIDVSSVNGPNNVFAQNRHSGKIDVFIFDWRDDPRKDDAWYADQCEKLDPIVVAQEIDRDYMASIEGVLIPRAWINASLDAIDKLGLARSGENVAGVDVADEGRDKNAICGGRGIEVEYCEERVGKDSDIFATTEWVFSLCDEHGTTKVKFDGDGLGAGMRGDARVINERRRQQRLQQIPFLQYRGSGEVVDPEKEDVQGRANEDYFANRKAQEWWRVRTRFLRTWRWVVQGKPCEPSEIISINTKTVTNWQHLVSELGQPTFKSRDDGKVLIDKAPKETKSPNKADALVIKFARGASQILKVRAEVLAKAKARGLRPMQGWR